MSLLFLMLLLSNHAVYEPFLLLATYCKFPVLVFFCFVFFTSLFYILFCWVFLFFYYFFTFNCIGMVIKYLCSFCKKPCKCNQKAILCNICNKWSHQKCNQLSINEFNTLGNSNLPYFCPFCNNNNFPFKSLSDEEFIALWSNHTKTSSNQVLTNKTQYCTLKTFSKNYKNLKDFIILL